MELVSKPWEANKDLWITHLEDQVINREVPDRIVSILDSSIKTVSFTDYHDAANDLNYWDRTEQFIKENQENQVFKDQIQNVIESLYFQYKKSLLENEEDSFYSREVVEQVYKKFNSQKRDDVFYTLKRQDDLSDIGIHNHLKAIFETELRETRIQNMKDKIFCVK